MSAATNLYQYKVTIPFRYGDTVSSWDSMCAECVDHYGLPGDKYKTEITADYMNFYFKDERDAIWFRLQCE